MILLTKTQVTFKACGPLGLFYRAEIYSLLYFDIKFTNHIAFVCHSGTGLPQLRKQMVSKSNVQETRMSNAQSC